MKKEKFCPVMPAIIGSVWCLFGVIFYYSEGNLRLNYWPILLAHIAFFVFFLCSILFTYNAFALMIKIEAEESANQKEFENKKTLEELQKQKYEEAKTKQAEENDFNKKVEEACEKVLENWETSYKENLKSLKSNVELYNDVKKIIEEKPEDLKSKENKSKLDKTK